MIILIPYLHLRKDLKESVKTCEACQKLQNMLDRNITDKKMYWNLKSTDSPAPRFYGLPKIHNPVVPIIPTVLHKQIKIS